MATPPRSAADWSLSPPSRRPIGVRAPATMTDPDMTPPAKHVCVTRTLPSARARRERWTQAGREEQVTVARAPAGRAGTMCRDERGASPSTCSSASTTSASPCPTWTRRSRSTATRSACDVQHEETNEEQGVREAMVAVGELRARASSCWRPIDETSTIAKFLDRSARACSSSPTGSPTSSRSPRCCASAACGCCTTSRGAARRTAGSTSCTPRTPAACSSSSSSRPPQH